jgi:D-amino peptidase
MGVPVALLSGDDRLEAQCAALFPGAKMAVVKTALGQRAARALSPANARGVIRQSAAEAVRGIAACRPYAIPGPYRLELDLSSVTLADLAAGIPVAERVSPRTVAFAADDMAGVLGWISAIGAMSTMLRQ